MIKEIKTGESKTLEFKLTLPDDSSKWIKTIIAFANGAGGKLILGVDNKRQVVGLDKQSDIFVIKDKITDTISQMCEPQIVFDISIENIANKELLVVEVFPGNHTPYYIKSSGKDNGTYIRLGATTRKADQNAINELTYKGQNISYDLLCNATYKINDKDIKLLCDEMSQISDKKITKKDIENLNLIINNKATNALAIMLGKHNVTSRVQCARFKGANKTNFLDKKEYENSLIEQINSAYNFVLNYLQMKIEINGVARDEKYEIPQGAIREAIINALVHRNYALNESVKVAIYDDRIEILSPGGLYGSMTLEDALSGRSVLRNPVIARSLEKIGIIESWGSGISRIKDLCANSGVKEPKFIEQGNSFRVIFYKKSAIKIGDKTSANSEIISNHKKIGDKNDKKSAIKIGDKTSANSEIISNHKKIGDKNDKKSAINSKILDFLASNDNATTAQIADFIGLKVSRTRELLNNLISLDKITAHGANKNRTYTLKS